MDVRKAIRQLRMEKTWLEEVIGSLEKFQRSKPFRAVALLDLARNGTALTPRSRRRLARWLREYNPGRTGRAAARSRGR